MFIEVLPLSTMSSNKKRKLRWTVCKRRVNKFLEQLHPQDSYGSDDNDDNRTLDLQACARSSPTLSSGGHEPFAVLCNDEMIAVNSSVSELAVDNENHTSDLEWHNADSDCEDSSIADCESDSEATTGDRAYNEEVLHSDSESDCDASMQDSYNRVRQGLAEWAIGHNITHLAINDLLKLLQNCNIDVPACAKTLLNTPRHTVIDEKSGGDYVYFGFQNGLTMRCACVH